MKISKRSSDIGGQRKVGFSLSIDDLFYVHRAQTGRTTDVHTCSFSSTLAYNSKKRICQPLTLQLTLNDILVEFPFFKHSHLDDTHVSVPAFPSGTNWKLHNVPVIPMFTKKIITNLDFSKSGNCESQISYILSELYNINPQESGFPDCRKASPVVPVFKNFGK